jgi:hypothetical protein
MATTTTVLFTGTSTPGVVSQFGTITIPIGVTFFTLHITGYDPANIVTSFGVADCLSYAVAYDGTTMTFSTLDGVANTAIDLMINQQFFAESIWPQAVEQGITFNQNNGNPGVNFDAMCEGGCGFFGFSGTEWNNPIGSLLYLDISIGGELAIGYNDINGAPILNANPGLTIPTINWAIAVEYFSS